MGAFATFAKNIIKTGIKKDYAKVKDKVAKPKNSASKVVALKPNTSGISKLSDKLARAKIELKQHSKSESATMHTALQKRVASLQKQLDTKKSKAKPGMSKGYKYRQKTMDTINTKSRALVRSGFNKKVGGEISTLRKRHDAS